MSSPSVETLQLALRDAGRALSTATVLFHQLVAARLQLNDTDHKCLDLLLREGEMTAGDLAARSGFTTGAVTGIANRLESHGLVRRASDPADLRRVLLQPVKDKVLARMGPLLQPMIRRMAGLHARYNAAELKLLTEYLQQCEAVMRESAAELAEAKPGPVRRRN